MSQRLPLRGFWTNTWYELHLFSALSVVQRTPVLFWSITSSILSFTEVGKSSPLIPKALLCYFSERIIQRPWRSSLLACTQCAQASEQTALPLKTGFFEFHSFYTLQYFCHWWTKARIYILSEMIIKKKKTKKQTRKNSHHHVLQNTFKRYYYILTYLGLQLESLKLHRTEDQSHSVILYLHANSLFFPASFLQKCKTKDYWSFVSPSFWLDGQEVFWIWSKLNLSCIVRRRLWC